MILDASKNYKKNGTVKIHLMFLFIRHRQI